MKNTLEKFVNKEYVGVSLTRQLTRFISLLLKMYQVFFSTKYQ